MAYWVIANTSFPYSVRFFKVGRDTQEDQERIDMRLARVAAGLTLAATASLGMGLASAGVASAEQIGIWKNYGNTNPITSSASTWRCGSTIGVGADLKAQVCAIRSRYKTSVQTAVIMRNNSSIREEGVGDIHTSMWTIPWVEVGDHWTCFGNPAVPPNSWSVCFGATLTHTGPVYAKGDAQYYLPNSPYV